MKIQYWIIIVVVLALWNDNTYAQDVKNKNEMQKIFEKFSLKKNDIDKPVKELKESIRTPNFGSYEVIGKPEISSKEDNICFAQTFSLNDGTEMLVEYMIFKTPEDAMKATNYLVSDTAWIAHVVPNHHKEQLGLEKYNAAFYHSNGKDIFYYDSVVLQCENIFLRVRIRSETQEKEEISKMCNQYARIIIERIKKRECAENTDEQPVSRQ